VPGNRGKAYHKACEPDHRPAPLSAKPLEKRGCLAREPASAPPGPFLPSVPPWQHVHTLRCDRRERVCTAVGRTREFEWLGLVGVGTSVRGQSGRPVTQASAVAPGILWRDRLVGCRRGRVCIR
jgi:hypothetical protein